MILKTVLEKSKKIFHKWVLAVIKEQQKCSCPCHRKHKAQQVLLLKTVLAVQVPWHLDIENQLLRAIASSDVLSCLSPVLFELTSFFYCCSITVVPISPCCSPLTHPPPVPTNNPHPVVHVHGSFIPISWLDSSPSFPSYSPLPTPLVTASLFLSSTSLVLFHLFICFVH